MMEHTMNKIFILFITIAISLTGPSLSAQPILGKWRILKLNKKHVGRIVRFYRVPKAFRKTFRGTISPKSIYSFKCGFWEKYKWKMIMTSAPYYTPHTYKGRLYLKGDIIYGKFSNEMGYYKQIIHFKAKRIINTARKKYYKTLKLRKKIHKLVKNPTQKTYYRRATRNIALARQRLETNQKSAIVYLKRAVSLLRRIPKLTTIPTKGKKGSRIFIIKARSLYKRYYQNNLNRIQRRILRRAKHYLYKSLSAYFDKKWKLAVKRARKASRLLNTISSLE